MLRQCAPVGAAVAGRLALALELLADDRLDVLLTGESPFDDLPAVLEGLAANPGDTLCHRIRYGPPTPRGPR